MIQGWCNKNNKKKLQIKFLRYKKIERIFCRKFVKLIVLIIFKLKFFSNKIIYLL